MAISFYSEEIDLPAINQEAVREWVRAVAKTYGKKAGEISYIFCSDEKILEVNRQYLQHDYYTDIITFDYTSGDKISGDLFISLDTVRTNSEAFHTDYNEELHRTIAPLRHQRQRPRRAGDHGGVREQGSGDPARRMPFLLSDPNPQQETRAIMSRHALRHPRILQKLPADENKITKAWECDYHRMETTLPKDGNDITTLWKYHDQSAAPVLLLTSVKLTHIPGRTIPESDTKKPRTFYPR